FDSGVMTAAEVERRLRRDVPRRSARGRRLQEQNAHRFASDRAARHGPLDRREAQSEQVALPTAMNAPPPPNIESRVRRLALVVVLAACGCADARPAPATAKPWPG